MNNEDMGNMIPFEAELIDESGQVRKIRGTLPKSFAPMPPVRIAADAIETIRREDMQDGKRYRIVFEGEYRGYGFIADGEDCSHDIEEYLCVATRIEEIGGEQ